MSSMKFPGYNYSAEYCREYSAPGLTVWLDPDFRRIRTIDSKG